jgi:hypothetical protein
VHALILQARPLLTSMPMRHQSDQLRSSLSSLAQMMYDSLGMEGHVQPLRLWNGSSNITEG